VWKSEKYQVRTLTTSKNISNSYQTKAMPMLDSLGHESLEIQVSRSLVLQLERNVSKTLSACFDRTPNHTLLHVLRSWICWTRKYWTNKSKNRSCWATYQGFCISFKTNPFPNHLYGCTSKQRIFKPNLLS
jgi:hypothetical protein